MKPLFVPLKRQYFEQIEAGAKLVERRPYGPRWNERTCCIGRPILFSLGYGKQHRLKGWITWFCKGSIDSSATDYVAIYGNREPVASIGFYLERR